MNFSKLKLVSEMYVQQPQGGQGTLAGANITVAANNKASQAAQAPKKVTNTSNNVGFQQNQMAQKQGNVKAATVQKQGGAPAKAATTGSVQSTIESYYNALRDHKEQRKQLDEKSSDWRNELKEALGKDDEVFHPYVEVMPFKDFKQNEVKKNMVKGVLKKGSAENPAQMSAKSELLKMGDEALEERVYMQPRGAERKREEKEDKKRKAEAAKGAVRHARLTKGIPFSDSKGKGYIKNGEKIYEQVLEEGKKKSKAKKEEKKTPKNAEEAIAKNPRLKAKLDKAERDFVKADNESKRHAKEALKHHKDQIAHKKAGRHKQSLESGKKGSEAAHKAQAARAAGMKYIPVGSRTYSKAGNPASMNAKFQADSKTSKGRKEILARVMEGTDPTAIRDNYIKSHTKRHGVAPTPEQLKKASFTMGFSSLYK